MPEIARFLPLVILIGLALASPADAHDCSGPDDCARVVGGSSIFAALLALLLAAAPAVKKPWKTVKDKREFKDCAAARSHVGSAEQTAEAEPRHLPKLSGERTAQQPDGSWETSVTVTWAPDAESSTMTLPEWTWPNMSKAQQTALNDFADALKVHEQGHFTVADKVAKDAGTTVTGSGADAAAARAELQKQLEQHREDVGSKLRQASDDYDTVTQHGAKQTQGPSKGYPGGKDAILSCP